MTEIASARLYAPLLAWRRLAEPARDPLSEAELSTIWAGQSFPPEALRTVSGKSVDVIYPGRRNGGPGPDFRDAVLLIDGRERRGDVELHVRASSFRGHGHHLDRVYDGLALHLVYLADDGAETRLSDDSLVPVAALAPWLVRRQADLQAWLQAPALWREPCRDASARLGLEGIDAALVAAGQERFQASVARMRSAIDVEGAETALWLASFETLGAGGDRVGFRRLARLFSPGLTAVLAQEQEPETALEDALLALAGLRPLPALGVVLPPALSPPLAAAGRPANRPERRLAALVRLYLRAGGDLPAYALGTVAAAAGLKDLLTRWQVASASGPALLGPDRAQEMLLNAVLPFAATKEHLVGRVEGLLAQMKPAPAYGKTAFLEANLRSPEGRRPVRSVLAQQGLLAFLDDWCSRGGCGRCPLS